MTNPFLTLYRAAAARPRLFAGVAVGASLYTRLPADFAPVTRGIMAWDVGVAVYLLLALHLFVTETTDRMRADAEAQREGEWTIFWLTLGAVIASFAAILSEFGEMKAAPAEGKTIHVVLVAVTLLTSWLMTHVTFTFRYAREYYGVPGGGLEFPGEARPDFLDFLYFSMGLGTTFQVSDVQITARRFRHMATVHGLLSFLFNTIVLALTINLASGLL